MKRLRGLVYGAYCRPPREALLVGKEDITVIICLRRRFFAVLQILYLRGEIYGRGKDILRDR